MTNDEMISAMAEVMVPFVRKSVAEAFGKAIVPPELAAEIAKAVRLLHESPTIRIEHDEPAA